jgi:hypothetical protein
VDFFNIYQIKGKTLNAKMGEKTIVVNKHLIADIFKISNKGCKTQKHANKQIAGAMFQHIALPKAYVKTKQWNVSEMKPPYDICLFALIQVIY